MRRARTGAISAAIIAIVAVAAPSGAASATPPTATALERATQRFLSLQPLPASAPPRARGQAAAGLDGGLFPDNRLVSFYGAPQMGQTILGMRSPPGAARKLATQSAPYGTLGERPVIGGFDLVSVFATAGGGADGLYRFRQSEEVIEIYLAQARESGLRLMLDIQPGRSTFSTEVEALADWLAQPEVDVALDPEWNVGRRGIPGRTPGKVGARQVNRVVRAVSAIVRENDLPPKLVVVHQFRRQMIRRRARIKPRPGVQVLLNYDGIGSPGAKAAGYASLASPTLFDGFSLFYQRDTPLMKPAAVLALEPEPDLLLYQ